MSKSVLEQFVPIIVNRLTLFSADQIWGYLLLNNRFSIRECIFIKKTHKSQEWLSFAIVRRC